MTKSHTSIPIQLVPTLGFLATGSLHRELADWSVMARFHRRVRVGSVRKGAVRVSFPLPKSGHDPD